MEIFIEQKLTDTKLIFFSYVSLIFSNQLKKYWKLKSTLQYRSIFLKKLKKNDCNIYIIKISKVVRIKRNLTFIKKCNFPTIYFWSIVNFNSI